MGRPANGISGSVPDWHARAYCRWIGQDGWRLFFPVTGTSARDLADVLYQEYCGGCPVLVQCLAYAMERGEYGIWAGTTEDDRRKLARIKTRTKCPVCRGDDPEISTAMDRRQNGRIRVAQLCLFCGHSWYAETNITTELPGTRNERRRMQRTTREAIA
jgi:hypothetical protein